MNNIRKIVVSLITAGLVLGVSSNTLANAKVNNAAHPRQIVKTVTTVKTTTNSTSSNTKQTVKSSQTKPTVHVLKNEMTAATRNHFTAPVTIGGAPPPTGKLTRNQVVFGTAGSTRANANKLVFKYNGKTPSGQRVVSDGVQNFTYTYSRGSYTVTPYKGPVK